ncbi:hypothetical protein GF339_03375 [candidate division KSB3 bacterium]|uniref:Dihydrodipicolinate synthase family protein n=1 Tax=candidate division KSB3 bacterium TaxID=2044937 RepID=A0A9D5JST5_9BACT|nr:hypothetical protein [candidate division KSB3 bacterium]MBD3323598.1 hypothetical protein [candidate division KSB3 bacterium]
MYQQAWPEFSWIQGEDLLDGQSCAVGADGLVTGLGNVWIDPYMTLFRHTQEGRLDLLNEDQKTINQLFELIRVTGGKVGPAIKAATTLLGRSHKWMKLSELTLRDDEIAKVKQVLEHLDLL